MTTNNNKKEFDLIVQFDQYLGGLEEKRLEKELNKKKKHEHEIFVNKIKTSIEHLLENFNYEIAKQKYELIKDDYPFNDFEELVEEARLRQIEKEHQKFVERTKKEILDYLKRYEFKNAQELFLLIRDDYSRREFLTLLSEYSQRKKKEELKEKIYFSLENLDLQEADQISKNSNLISEEEFKNIISEFIGNYFIKLYDLQVNQEQANSLTMTDHNLLVTARAGSGKTRVITLKALMLMDLYHISPDEILIMAFNKKASLEITKRIKNDLKHPFFDNARTFHSLAFQLVQPEEELLFDERVNTVSEKKMSLFVQQLLKTEIQNPTFWKKIYDFFRRESWEIDRVGFLLSDLNYYDFRRDQLHITLYGELVKSLGEKYIADYLFEHDITYVYEKVWLWGKKIYRPDFSLYENQRDFVLEHWAIDPDDPDSKLPDDWPVSRDEYIEQIHAKRNYWKEKSIVLIETCSADLRSGRVTFEITLQKKLAQKGIIKSKLSEDELLQKIKNKDWIITKLAELFTQFIQRSKKFMLNANEIQKRIRKYQTENEREAVFLDLASRIFLEYEKNLVKENKIDFDDLLLRAIDVINKTQGQCKIFLGPLKSRSVRMCDLQWILIDEYQDFSPLFYKLIITIKKYNPGLHLICVGDDWQAINAFAGSDLKYFRNFSNLVSQSEIAHLLTNFRSQDAIVRNSNLLMEGLGNPGKSHPDNFGGEVAISYVDDVWIELRGDAEYAHDKKLDEVFLDVKNNNLKKFGNKNIIVSKYLKACYIILTNIDTIGKEIAILTRTNFVEGLPLDQFKVKLLECLRTSGDKYFNFEKHIHVSTVHAYKGLEADIVIILDACQGSFPLVHPDNLLFKIFGRDNDEIFDEERRLFYVAITRAKEKLFILAEKENPSEFLKTLNPNIKFSLKEMESIKDDVER